MSAEDASEREPTVVGRGLARRRAVASRVCRKAGKGTARGGGDAQGTQEGRGGRCAWGRGRRGGRNTRGRRRTTNMGEWGADAEGGLRMGAQTPGRVHRARPGVEGSEGRDRPPSRGGEAAGAAGLGARAAGDLSAWSEPARRLIWRRRSQLRW
jgi:hypothetical protein